MTAEPSRTSVKLWSRRADVVARVPETLRQLALTVEFKAAMQVRNESYLDTDKWRLYQAGVACRLSTGPEGTRLVVEPVAVAGGRLPLTPNSLEEELPEPPLCFPSPLPGTVISEQFRPVLRDALVHSRLRLTRSGVLYQASMEDGLHVELECEAVRVVNSAPVQPFTEITLNVPHRDAGQVDALLSQLVSKLGLTPCNNSTLTRALEFAGIAPPALVEGDELKIRRTDRLVDAAYRTLRRHFQRMVWNEPGTRLGLDPEWLHDMRVATRRLREALRVFREALPARRAAVLQRHLRWLGRALGRVRDLDVYIVRLDDEARAVNHALLRGIEFHRNRLVAQREKARAAMFRALDSQRCVRFVDRLRRFLDAGPPKRPRAQKARRPVGAEARSIIRRKLSKVLRAGRAIGPQSPDEQLHLLRIKCKRLRYAVEFFSDLYGLTAVKFARRVTRLQDILGAHQDAVVSRAAVAESDRRAAAPRSRARETYFAIGYLMAQHMRRAQASRIEFAKAWKQFDRKKVRRPLKQRLKKREPSVSSKVYNV